MSGPRFNDRLPARGADRMGMTLAWRLTAAGGGALVADGGLGGMIAPACTDFFRHAPVLGPGVAEIAKTGNNRTERPDMNNLGQNPQ